jgi:hypothetical protein
MRMKIPRDQHGDLPATHNSQGQGHGCQLGNETQGRLVDRSRCLNDTDHQTDGQRHAQ